MVAYTTTYNFAKPTVGDDEDAWGGYLNGNFDTLESLLKGTTALTSLNLSGNITFGDGDRAVFGADSDLQIWFDGTHSRIEDSATNAGDLYIRGSNNLRLQTWDGVSSWQNAIVLDDAGAAELYHDGALKLTSTSTGIDVTGNATFDDNGKAILAQGLTYRFTTMVLTALLRTKVQAILYLHHKVVAYSYEVMTKVKH